jgi:uncharacterized OB-fold protein
VTMNYEDWIDRERRVRTKILGSSPEIRKNGVYRLCADCGEICLCYEEICPNCNCGRITMKQLSDTSAEVLSGKRIRCRYRYDRLISE